MFLAVVSLIKCGRPNLNPEIDIFLNEEKFGYLPAERK